MAKASSGPQQLTRKSSFGKGQEVHRKSGKATTAESLDTRGEAGSVAVTSGGGGVGVGGGNGSARGGDVHRARRATVAGIAPIVVPEDSKPTRKGSSPNKKGGSNISSGGIGTGGTGSGAGGSGIVFGSRNSSPASGGKSKKVLSPRGRKNTHNNNKDGGDSARSGGESGGGGSSGGESFGKRRSKTKKERKGE